MKKVFLALLTCVALAVSMPSLADGVYVKASVGQSELNAGRTINQTAWGVGAGYNFDKNFGVEVGYADLGKNSGAIGLGGLGASVSGKGESIYVAGVGNWNLSEEFSLFAKLGMAQNRIHISGTTSGLGAPGSFSLASSNTDVYAAVGAAYQLTKELAATIDYNHYGNGKLSDVNFKLSAWTIGLRYGF